MKRYISQRLRFPEIRRDEWLSTAGQLSKEEEALLNWRKLLYFSLIIIKSAVLLPVTTARYVVNFVKLLNELERLHYSPLRRTHRGKGCVIDRQTWLANGNNIHLADFVKISAFSTLIAGHVSTIKIGTNTIVGPGVTIVSINHGIHQSAGPIRYQKWKEDSILIGDDVWIGANVVILPGAILGSGSVIGAGTVIRGKIPPMTITYNRNGQLITVQRK